MLFRRIVSEGLAHYSYVIGDGGDAVVIDPRRDIDVYVRIAQEHDMSIRTILETHRNEDYVIGSTALAAATDAEICHSVHLDFAYGTAIAAGDAIDAGRLRLRAIETPGHTPDSLTFALADTASSEDPVLAFTGDALFVGDTGRTDLGGQGQARAWAELLYDSLMGRILPLGAGVILCPAHGGGSVCGGNISDRALSTLGYEARNNPSLADMDRARFVEAKLAEQHLHPPYFARMEGYNQLGNAPIYPRVPVPAPLSAGELAEHIAGGATVVDARMPQAFAGGHIPGSLNVWRAGLSAYLPWAVPIDAPMALVLPEGANVHQVARGLFRIGYDEVIGYLSGGFEAWQNEGRPVARIDTIDTTDLRARLDRGDDIEIVDVRPAAELAAGTIEGARTIFVGDLDRRAEEIPRGKPVVVMCSVGHRGGLGASILARAGFDDVANYLGGYSAWTTQAERSRTGR